MQLYCNILGANFVDLKNSINRQINGDFEPLNDFGINNFWAISPSDVFEHILEND
jgi:hypothetical protein